MFRRVGPGVFVQAPAGCEPQRRRRTICAAQSGAARKRGRRRRRPERGRERREYREEGQCRGKRASAPPGTTARWNRDRNVPQAKNDSFLPSWHPVPEARSVRSPARRPSDHRNKDNAERCFRGKGYDLRRRAPSGARTLLGYTDSQSGRRPPLVGRRGEEQPAAHSFGSFPGSARENNRVSSNDTDQPGETDGAASHGEPGRYYSTDLPDDRQPDDPAASGICRCYTRNQVWRSGRSMGGSWRAQAQPERA